MRREPFKAGDIVTKDRELGVVVERVSKRTQRPYLTVSITRGPRKGQLEFPERGWTVDEGNTGGNERPSHEPDDHYLRPKKWLADR